MTDGIIQQILHKWINYCLSGEHGLKPSNSFEFRELQQELIANILRIHEESIDISETYSDDHVRFYLKLIGDNQE